MLTNDLSVRCNNSLSRYSVLVLLLAEDANGLTTVLGGFHVFLICFLLCRLKPFFPKQGSLKGCFRNVKAQSSHIDLKRMRSSGVSFGCDSDLLVTYLEPRCSVDTCWSIY